MEEGSVEDGRRAYSKDVYLVQKKDLSGEESTIRVIFFPGSKTIVGELLGEDPKGKLGMLVKSYSASEIAQQLSNEDRQVSTFAVNCLQMRYGLVNSHKSPESKFNDKYYDIFREAEHRSSLNELTSQEQVLLLLKHGVTSHKATDKEIQRLFKLGSSVDAKILYDRTMRKIAGMIGKSL